MGHNLEDELVEFVVGDRNEEILHPIVGDGGRYEGDFRRREWTYIELHAGNERLGQE